MRCRLEERDVGRSGDCRYRDTSQGGCECFRGGAGRCLVEFAEGDRYRHSQGRGVRPAISIGKGFA